jgi:hypothetical protein
MTPLKERAIRIIESMALPEECSFDELLYRMYVVHEIETGLEAVERGEVCSEKEADWRIDSWLDSLGTTAIERDD